MPTVGSNQYPALEWEENPDRVHGGIIARPHGAVSSVRVYYAAYYPLHAQWVWVINWPERFHSNLSSATEDEAKIAATVAYWDATEATPGWVQPPPPPPPPPLPPEVQAWRQRIEDWLASAPTEVEMRMVLSDMQHGPPIVTKAENNWAYARIVKALADRNQPRS